jgi:hypothetical protein
MICRNNYRRNKNWLATKSRPGGGRHLINHDISRYWQAAVGVNVMYK